MPSQASRRLVSLSFVALVGLASAACFETRLTSPNHERSAVGDSNARHDAEPSRPWDAPPLDQVTSIRDGRTGARVTYDEMFASLEKADAVFLGETHTDETTHRVELHVYETLLARRSGRLVLAMEMLERDAQAAVDAYLRGEIDEATYLSRSRPWPNYATAYRRLVEHARAHRAPVVASNFPASLRRKVTDEASMNALSPTERAFAPAQLFEHTPLYWRRVDNATRGHSAMMAPRAGENESRLYDTQSLWDNTMGESCALALDRRPGYGVLHVNGGFHTEYFDGTARQFSLRKPEASVRTVAIVTTANPFAAEVGGLTAADFVVFVREQARDVSDDLYTVLVPRELRYDLRVPSNASESSRVPLLVWLADDGESMSDALDAWRARLGDTCAIAVIEAPYRETQEDLVEGGRWYWSDSFRQDVNALGNGIAGTWAYLLRNVPVDPARVVIAGEGTGATVVAVTAMMWDDMPVHAVAITPRRFSQVKEFSLPLLELRGGEPPAPRTLDVVARASDEAWWSGELAEYRSVGVTTTLTVAGDDPWTIDLENENRVRAGLGLGARTSPDGAPRRHVIADGPRARAWARRVALARGVAGERVAVLPAPPDAALVAAHGPSSEISLRVRPADYAHGAKALPRAAGPFGGTTVIVLPEGLDAAEVEAWTELSKNDPLNKASRFHRMVLATTSGERTLPVVLGELGAKNRKNVLIVPATWCADGATMRALKFAARDFEDTMSLRFLPGLGGAAND